MPPTALGRNTFALLLSASLCAAPALAQNESESAGADPRIDDTGRDVAVYPPDPLFDYLHYRLVMDIPNMAEPKFSAKAHITIRPIAAAQDGIKLRAGTGLKIGAVTLDGRACTSKREEGTVEISFPGSLPAGRQAILEIVYDAEKPGGGGAGLTWSKDYNQTPEEDFMFHSQGQPESNHRWFPCHDFPNVRLTSEIEVTVPRGYEALSNGRLVAMKRLTDGSGRTMFHWLQDKPHSFYLISLIIGKFDVVNVGGSKSARPGLWMPIYGPLGSGENIRESFANTAEMVAVCEKLFDEPYPWDKYAQSIARDFSAGAMENTSATTFAPFAAQARGNFLDGIIMHELVHQWFGDLVGYRSWEHLWLGEGWATYGEAIWAEHKNGVDGYQRAILADMRSASNRTYAPRNTGMVTNRYSDPNVRFVPPNSVYQKGGFIIHMLRQRLGDDAFWKGVALYLDRYKFKLAETDDFRRCLEETSGQSLERFFDQWTKRPGNPSVEIDYTWDDSSKMLKVVVEQTQRIDADNPAFAITIPLDIETKKDGPWKTVYVNMDTRRSELSVNLEARPESIEVDPYHTVLMRSRVRQPLAALLRQAEHGRTYFTRAWAVDALGDVDDPRAAALLERIASTSRKAGDEYLSELSAAALKAITTRTASK